MDLSEYLNQPTAKEAEAQRGKLNIWLSVISCTILGRLLSAPGLVNVSVKWEVVKISTNLFVMRIRLILNSITVHGTQLVLFSISIAQITTRICQTGVERG